MVKKHFMLDHQNLLFLVIGSTICFTLCQWYISSGKVGWNVCFVELRDYMFLKVVKVGKFLKSS